VAALGLPGCGSTSNQTDAAAFIGEHAAAVDRAAAATKVVEGEVSRLSGSPTRAQLEELAGATGRARRDVVQIGEWDVGSAGQAGAEEEDLPRAETQVTEAANELAGAMSALHAYARAPSAATLARYQSELARGREQWDEAISQIWYLAHESHPATV